MKNHVVLIGSETLGRGDDTIGGVIMTNFLRFLAEQEEKPNTIILWNTGVKLAAGSSDNLERATALEHLRQLEQAGVAVLVCHTCLEYFGLLEQVKVGKVSGMKAFVPLLLQNDVLSV